MLVRGNAFKASNYLKGGVKSMLNFMKIISRVTLEESIFYALSIMR
jgi:hypothetical protein